MMPCDLLVKLRIKVKIHECFLTRHTRQEWPPHCLAWALWWQPREASLLCGVWLSLVRTEVLFHGLPRKVTLLPVGVSTWARGEVLSLRVRLRGEVELRVVWPCRRECMVCFQSMVSSAEVQCMCLCLACVWSLGCVRTSESEWKFFTVVLCCFSYV